MHQRADGCPACGSRVFYLAALKEHCFVLSASSPGYVAAGVTSVGDVHCRGCGHIPVPRYELTQEQKSAALQARTDEW